MNKTFWTEKGNGCVSDPEISYGSSSRTESKRTHQWLMDGDEAEAVPNKKHIVEVPTHNYFYGLLNSNLSGWSGASNLQSPTGQYTDQQDDKNTDFDDRNIPSFGQANMVLGNKEDPFGTNSSFGLSMSHTLEDPRDGLNYSGIRKVKVSQVKEPENSVLESSVHGYNRGAVNSMPTPHPYGNLDETSVSMGLSFNQINENILPMDNTFNRGDTNFMSLGQPMIHPYVENNNTLSMGQSFSTDVNISTMGITFKDNISTLSMDHSFRKGDDSNVIPAGNPYKKMDENKNLSMDNTFGKGNSNIISFGGFQDDDVNSSGGLICSYDLLMGQASGKRAEARSDKGLVETNVDAIVSAANILSSTNKAVPKDDQKGNKKVHPNNFPSNVRSLLSTGMLDGVSVKYIAWSREKELCGTIRGSSYLCGCQSCNFSKAINAYEFERHAGCKTKHPNNHIYFENGKTVYGIVQELRNTPQNLLFEVIQTITGSPINQKSFRLWKESFLAATRELQRIYGNDGGKQLS